MKKRLDELLVELNYYSTRNKAQAAIKNGDIMVDGTVITKCSFSPHSNAKIEILKESIPYVSRGGLKLEKALNTFKIKVKDLVCMDIGASTGGFSDCLLQHGAKLVYALDVGTNQLVESLKNNERIISMENTNFRYLDITKFKYNKLDFICADVSFISLSYLFENVAKILNKEGYFIALIKPQFETEKSEHNKNGLVNDQKVHYKVIERLIKDANSYNLNLNKITFSPIKGEKAHNIEYLGLFSFKGKNINLINISDIIELAYQELR